VCTGQYLADNSFWIAIASILAAFTITNAVDEHGEIIVPESSLTDGLVRRVLYFLVVLSRALKKTSKI
jgi:hypothetical protein